MDYRDYKAMNKHNYGNDFIAGVSTRTWRVEISQNGWEYTGYANIKCKECKKIDDNKVLADGIEIEFDEEINEPYVC